MDYYKANWKDRQLVGHEIYIPKDGEMLRVNCNPCDRCGYMKSWDVKIKTPSGKYAPVHVDYKLDDETMKALKKTGQAPDAYCKAQKFSAKMLGNGECIEFQNDREIPPEGLITDETLKQDFPDFKPASEVSGNEVLSNLLVASLNQNFPFIIDGLGTTNRLLEMIEKDLKFLENITGELAGIRAALERMEK
jgi:hypothetical protein